MLTTWWLRLRACRALCLQTSVLFVKQGGEGDRADLLYPEASEQKATSFSAGCPSAVGLFSVFTSGLVSRLISL